MVEKKVAIVWFKHDLRMDDHPGLASAAQYDHVLPLFILDSSFYAGWSEERLAILFDAVADLRRSLKLIDSTLVIRKGRSKDVLLGLALQVHTMEIIAEEEIEEIWHDLLGSVSASLSVKSLSGPKTGVKYWRAPLYDLEDIEDLPDNYKEFICMRRRVLLPQNASTSLPSLPTDTEPGELPSLVDFIAISKKKSEENPFCEVLKAAQSQSAERLLLGEPHDTNGNVQQVTNATNATNAVERNWINPFSKQGDELPFNSVWEHKRYRIANVKTKSEVGKISGGATGALNMLREYLKALEITHNRRGGRIYEQILELEKRSGASFRAIFNRVLELGTLSRRRVYYEVVKYERDRGRSYVSPFGCLCSQPLPLLKTSSL
ncbi:hypothetical protein KC19_VG173400 [Ceratodon purpureus]|uniref:Photolyase/cryptochrome alpha/beta domain-containing protein n=1 Tax=Ceratodon purpureus TaxID=3225 RepID=A0A8T0HRI1_CERPU|nr:hypothetical protein KC19_VG173400 [Ceratodon purpureus]